MNVTMSYSYNPINCTNKQNGKSKNTINEKLYEIEVKNPSKDLVMIGFENGKANILSLPDGDNEEYFTNPNNIDGELTKKIKNEDGTYTSTYKNYDGTYTKVTGKKQGLFGLGKYDTNSDYTLEEYDSCKRPAKSTEKNSDGIDLTFYDESGNKQISIGLTGFKNDGNHDSIYYFNNGGYIFAESMYVREYNSDGSSFTEEIKTGDLKI